MSLKAPHDLRTHDTQPQPATARAHITSLSINNSIITPKIAHHFHCQYSTIQQPHIRSPAMAHPFRPASPAEELLPYYEELGDDNISYCFRDFDVERNFDLFD